MQWRARACAPGEKRTIGGARLARAGRRRKKKRRKREAANTTKVVKPGKGGLSDAEFAALGAGYDPTLPGSGDFDLYANDKFGDDKWD